MANPALGTKRLCGGCAAKFYDLGKDPIVCPTCETVFVIPKAPPPRGGRSGYSPRSVYDPNSGPARSMGTLAEEAPAIADDAEPKDGAEDAAGGVPMLEEIDEK